MGRLLRGIGLWMLNTAEDLAFVVAWLLWECED